jgi:hypothetical protein
MDLKKLKTARANNLIYIFVADGRSAEVGQNSREDGLIKPRQSPKILSVNRERKNSLITLPMKTLLLTALLATTALMATPVRAQYDDDIYYSKSSAKKAAYQETPTWETSANKDWDVDSYNRRTTDDNSSFHFEWPESSSNGTGTTGTTVNAATPDTVYVVEQYYYTDRLSRFHNPLLSVHLNSPFFDVAFYDPFYWDYCYYDPWWYVTPSFGFRYGSWYVGWNPGYYSGWYGGWYAPYFHPQPHYFQPGLAAGGHGFGRPLPNRGSRVNNLGGHYRPTMDNRNFAGRGGAGRNAVGRGEAAAPGRNNVPGRTQSGVNPGRAAGNSTAAPSRTQGRVTTARPSSINASSLGRVSNMRANGSTATSRTQNTSTTSRATGSYTPTTSRVHSSSDNSSARRTDNGVRQSSTGRSTVTRTTPSNSNTSSSSSSRTSNVNSSRSSSTSNTTRSSSTTSSSSRSGGSSRGSSGGGGRSGGGRR